MKDDQFQLLLAALGAYSLGAVYLLATLAAALVYAAPIAVLLVLSSAGVGYLAQVSAFLKFYTASQWCWSVSVICGVAAFVFTLIGI